MKQPDDSDQLLVHRAQAGSKEALGVLLQRHEPQLRRVVGRMLRRTEDVQDALQETSVRVTAALASFRANAPFGPWVRRIATNVTLSTLRRNRPRETAVLSGDLPSGGSDPAQGLIQAEQSEQLQHLLGRLPTNHRRILELRLVTGLTNSEIAELMKVPQSSVRVMFGRAVEQLRKRAGVGQQ